MAIDVAKLKAANAKRWAAAKLTRGPEFGPVAARLLAGKARFQAMEARTGVPWFVIAVIKERESGADPQWLRSIAQGQPWNKVSTIVPKGRGPFKSWEEAAYDALVNCPPYAARNKDWSIGGILTLLEGYNGFGYAQRGLPSPYVWSGTDQYSRGKYVADHQFDPNAVDKQLGCAGLILALQAIDPTIKFEAPKPTVTPADAGKAAGGAVVAGTVAAGAQQGWGAWEWGLLAAAVVVVAVVVYLVWRWWKRHQVQPEPYHAVLLSTDRAKSSGALAALQAPADVWKPQPKPVRKRRKTATKPKAKKRKTSKRKAA
jgi:lysozyme family protein